MNLYFTAKDIDKAYGEVFNIGGGIENSLSLLELFDLLENKLDIEMTYTQLPWRESDQKVFVADIEKLQGFWDGCRRYRKKVALIRCWHG